MTWGTVAMAAVSAAGSIYSANQASAQNKTQQEWNVYNAKMGYSTAQANIASQTMLGLFNASLQMKAAEANAAASMAIAEYNAGQVKDAVTYNNLLLEEEERLQWETYELDQAYMERQRSQERGEIANAQASSGITMGEGSHQEVIVGQMKQEAIDAFVLRHNAEVGAAQIHNAMAQNSYQGATQVQKIMYEGQVGAAVTMNNARLAAMGSTASALIGASASTRSAEYALAAGMSGASQTYSANQAQISNNLTKGLFSSAAQAGSAYYAGKSTTTSFTTSNSNSGAAVKYSSPQTSQFSLMNG